MPVSMMLGDAQRRDPAFHALNMLGRLAPAAGVKQANTEMQVLWQAFLQREAAAVPEKDRPRFLQQRAAVLSGANGIDLMEFRGNYAAALLMLWHCGARLASCLRKPFGFVARARRISAAGNLRPSGDRLASRSKDDVSDSLLGGRPARRRLANRFGRVHEGATVGSAVCTRQDAC